MKREPLLVYVLRLAALWGIVFLLLMLWWSSNLVERDLIELKELVKKGRYEGSSSTMPKASLPVKPFSLDPEQRGDPTLPNLLETDPFFTTTLPKLLPPDFKPLGVRKEAALGKPDNLHPFSNWAHITPLIRACGVNVAGSKFGFYETLTGDMALKMEVKGTPPEYTIYLRDDVYWQPLEPQWFPEGFKLAPQFQERVKVTAHDFKFALDALMNPSLAEAGAVSMRTFLDDIESLEVIDDLTFVVKWKNDKYISKELTGSLYPLPKFVYAYFPDGQKIVEEDSDPDTYRKNPLWALNFSNHWAKNIIVGCGAWLFDSMSDRGLRLKRNPDHWREHEALSSAMEVEFKASPEGMWQAFKEGKLDTYTLAPHQLLEFEQFLSSPIYLKQEAEGKKIHRLDYIGQSYTYIAWNSANPLFASSKVRRALTSALDRDRIIRQTLNGQGVAIHGSFYVHSPSTNPALKPWPFDPEKAKRWLAEEGWYDSDGDGLIDKEIGGRRVPFRFKLSYYVKNPNSKAIAEYVAGALLALGIKVDLNGVELADLTKDFEDKSFEALLLAWALGAPPEDPRQLWHSEEADKKGSSNAIGFRNQEADTIIEQLNLEKEGAQRLKLYHRFDEILHEEQPYTFLFAPKVTFLYRDWLKNVFIPAKRQDLIPGATVPVPTTGAAWIEEAAWINERG